jgi:cell division protein ZapA (FtsZ GTPase activity inhibitor)
MEVLDSKQLTVTIAGRPYPLKIKANDEPAIRRIVKEVNDKINQFQLAYPGREKQDCVALVLLAYAVDLYKASSNAPAAPPEQELSELQNVK